MGLQRRLHRFAYLIIQILLSYYLWFAHAIQPLYFSSMSSAPELNTGNIALAHETGKPIGSRFIVYFSRG